MREQFPSIKRQEFWPILLASMLPLIFTLLWLVRNTQLPGNDAANYMMTAINIYHYFTDRGLLSGILHFYTERGWRPIFFPNLAVPFLLVSHGNLFFTYWSVAISCILASTVYIYLFFRLSINRYSAIIAANLVGLLPLIQAQVVMFYAEAALFFCVLGCLYHLIKSNYLTNAVHTAGFVIFLFFALIIRPVEAATDLFFVLLYFLIAGWWQGVFKINQITKLIAMSFLTLTLFLALASRPYLHTFIAPVIDNGGALDKKMAKTLFSILIVSSVITSIIAIAIFKLQLRKLSSLCYLHLKKLSGETLLLPAFAIIFMLVLAWFLPAAPQTFEWVYRTSLGDVASSTGTLNGSQFSWLELKKYILAEGQACVLMITVVAALRIIFSSKQENKRILLSLPVIYLLLILPFPFWESFYTVQVVTRKLSIAFPAVLMAFLIIGLQQGKFWAARFVVIALLMLLQFALLIGLLVTNTYTNPSVFFTNMIGYFIPQASTIHPNPHDVVISFLDEQAKKYNLHNIGLEVRPGTPDARHFIEAAPINPFLLSTMLVAMNKEYSTSYPYYGVYADSNFENLVQRYDAIFLSDTIKDMVISPAASEEYNKKQMAEVSPSLKVFYNLLNHYTQNQLSELGWIKGPCLLVKTQKYGDYQGCLLIKKI